MRIFRLQPSRIEWVLIILGHGAGLLALIQTALSVVVVLGLSLLLLGNLQQQLALSGAGRRKRIRSITIGAQHCVLQSEETELTTALPQLIYYSEWLLVLGFSAQAGATDSVRSKLCSKLSSNLSSKRILLWPDSLDRESDRRLRRYLRFDCPPASN